MSRVSVSSPLLVTVFAIALAAPALAPAQGLDLLKKAAKAAAGSASAGKTSPAAADQTPVWKTDAEAADGELVVTKKRPASFAEAKANATTEVADGDEVWVAIRTSKPLSTYAQASNYAGAAEYYQINLAISPAGDKRVFDNCFWYLLPQEAAGREVILGLTPVSARAVKAHGGSRMDETKLTCWLRVVADDNSRPGVWRNQISLVSMHESNGTGSATISSARLTANVPNGFPKWNATLKKSGGACDPNAKPNTAITCAK